MTQLILVRSRIEAANGVLPEIPIRVDRRRLAKRVWRAVAEDGTEFGCELAEPLKHGDTVHQSDTARYVVQQEPEPLLEISLNLAPSAAAGIGWAVGNLHLELCAEPTRLLTADEPAARQLLERLQVPYLPVMAIFRPGRFARGQLPTHELGSSHH